MKLAELIDRLEALDPAMVCRPAFGAGDSWRGSYDEVAFRPLEESTVAEMLQEARAMDGATIHGYKGGEYYVSPSTGVNVAAWGEYGGDSDRMDVWWAANMEAAPLRARLDLLERLVATAPDTWRAKAEALRRRCADAAYGWAEDRLDDPPGDPAEAQAAVLAVPLEES